MLRDQDGQTCLEKRPRQAQGYEKEASNTKNKSMRTNCCQNAGEDSECIAGHDFLDTITPKRLTHEGIMERQERT